MCQYKVKIHLKVKDNNLASRKDKVACEAHMCFLYLWCFYSVQLRPEIKDVLDQSTFQQMTTCTEKQDSQLTTAQNSHYPSPNQSDKSLLSREKEWFY